MMMKSEESDRLMLEKQSRTVIETGERAVLGDGPLYVPSGRWGDPVRI